MSKVIYITAKAPFGSEEAFIIPEMIALKRLGVDLIIIPRDKVDNIFHKNAESLVNDTLSIPWFNFKIFITLLRYIFIKPMQLIVLLYHIFYRARNFKVGLRNLVILPKSLYISELFKKESISHIHAHWASTPSTMAYIINKITGIPWSFTSHRWDIAENNILREKCKTASFVRAISRDGRDDILRIIRDYSLKNKIKVIHMGVNIPELNGTKPGSNIFTILCPANLVNVKGHKYLLDACRLLDIKDFEFKCMIAGDGPLENDLKAFVSKNGLDKKVSFLGRIPHEELLNLYKERQINVVVLPSIITEDGEKEGIPVALMEAMSFGIPVIATDTGGTAELLRDECGIMVEEKNSKAIADAIEQLYTDNDYYDYIARKGRERVSKLFNLTIISQELLRLFSDHCIRYE
jgi:glycosyltransferase involved in cell wall biosynthesis